MPDLPIDTIFWPPLDLLEWERLMEHHHIDPYLVWSDLTNLRQFIPSGGAVTEISFLVELDQAYERKTSLPGWVVPHVYDEPLDASRTSRFVTVRLVTATDTASKIKDLIETPGVQRVQLGFPVSQSAGKVTSIAPNFSGSITLPQGVTTAVTCAVLDDGCPFAHSQVRVPDEPRTRVIALWDQTPAVDADPAAGTGEWAPPARMPYGVELTNSMLDPILAANELDREFDEDLCYAQAYGPRQHGMDECRTHGTAVLDLMAGRFDPRRHDPPPLGKDEPCARTPIVFVQFPSSETNVSNGRWLAVNALDGLRYVIDVVSRLPGESPSHHRKIIANMSYGALAGPHDGTGMLVRAMDELGGIRGNLAIVLAAGNSQSAYSHAKRRIKAPPKRPGNDQSPPSVCFHAVVPPDKSYETYLEIWFDGVEDAKHATVRVTPPFGSPKSVGWGRLLTWSVNDLFPGTGNTDLVAAAIFPRTAVQGTKRTMMLLVMAGTQLSGTYVSAPSGEWRVDVSTVSGRPTHVEAWLERDDVRYAHRSQFAHFDDDDDEPNTCVYVTRDNTLTSVAGGKNTFAVGGYVDVDPVPSSVTNAQGVAVGSGKKAVIANYSGLGAKATNPPVYARTDCGYALQGVKVAGTRSGATTRISGTSAAAPQLGRALLNAMSQIPGNMSAGQVMKLLTQLLRDDPSLLLPGDLEPSDERRLGGSLLLPTSVSI